MATDPKILSLSPNLLAPARQVSLLRLLLLAIGLGVMVLTVEGHKPELVQPAAGYLRILLVTVGVLSAALAFTVDWVSRRWQLALHMVFDLLWSGVLIHFSGGIASPGVVLLFAIILISSLVLHGVVPFVIPALASLILAGTASLYLAHHTPFPDAYFELYPALSDTNRILGMLATQVAALFLVDMLGQLLSRRLHEQRIFTDELIDQLGEGVLAVERLGTIAYVNAEAVRLLGLASSDIQGRPVAEVLGRDDLRPVLAMVNQELCPAMQRYVGPEQRQLVLRVTQLVGRRSRPIGRTLLIADESRLRELEESAQRSEHLAVLGEMAAGIAHEVRNPLTSLRGCAQELADICRGAGQPDAADLAGIMVGESDRLARIVEDFLAMSRMRPPQREAIHPEDVFTDLRALYAQRRDLPEQLNLTFAVEEECPQLSADAGQLRQVLTNLINNSIDALRRESEPRLSVLARPASAKNPLATMAIEIVVTDNGCGITPEVRAKIFTPFFSTKNQGTGLGLSLVQRIVREHEGLLRLESEPGKGTTVSVLLPAHSQTRVFLRALGGDK